MVAGAAGRLARGGNGDHDDAERKHHQSHEFENQSVHDNIPQQTS
jgi:hypothetical protein